MDSSRSEHWDCTYTGRAAEQLSWFEPEPWVSLELIDALAARPDEAVVDVGGGKSRLVDELLRRGFSDVTVLDVSSVALEAVAERIGANTGAEWVVADVLAWRPARRYALWHDRAVFHFLVDPGEQAAYLDTLDAAGAARVVIATFAPDGPETCSGLPVARYGPEDLERLLVGFDVVDARRVVHVTPWGADQPFTWVAARSRTRSGADQRPRATDASPQR